MPELEVDRTERALLAAIKEHRGEKLLAKDRADLDWYWKKKGEEIIEDALQEIPKKTYVKLSGRASSQLNKQAASYDLPIAGPTVNLFDTLSAFHDLLAKYQNTIGADEDEAKLKKAKLKGEIEVLERRAKILDGEISQQKAKYIERSELRRRLSWLTSKLADLGDRLGKIGGPDAQRAANEFLEELAVEIEGGNLSIGGD